MHKFSWVLALLVLNSSLASCQTKSSAQKPTKQKSMLPAYQTEKFHLSASPGTADGYPVTIDKGRFFASTGGGFPIPWGHFLTSGWGGAAIGWGVGNEMQPAPDSMEIRWFSYTEDQFWEGKFLLPQQRIYALLKQGIWSAEQQKQLTYSGLSVSVLPTGGVVVWLDGEGQQVLIGRYQAHKVDYDYARHRPKVDRAADVRDTRAELSPEVQREIATGTLSAKKWDEYLLHYRWQLAFSQPLTLTRYGISYFSAERTGLPASPDMQAHLQRLLSPTDKAVPKSAMLYVRGAYGRQRLLKISPFDEQQTLAAFRTLHAQHPQEPLTLYVDVNEQLDKASLSLRAGTHHLPLDKTKVQFFDL